MSNVAHVTVHAFQPVTVAIRPFDLSHTRWELSLRIQIQLITDTITVLNISLNFFPSQDI